MKPKACSGNLLLSGSHAKLQLRAGMEGRMLSKVCCDLDKFPCSFPLWAVLSGIIYKIPQMLWNSKEKKCIVHSVCYCILYYTYQDATNLKII